MGQVALFAAGVSATLALMLALVRPRITRIMNAASVVMLSIAVLHVVWLLIEQDTSYEIVVDHTRPGLSVVRRIMGLWGGSAGSLLFFTLVVGSILVVGQRTEQPHEPRSRQLTGFAPAMVIAPLVLTSTFFAYPFTQLTNPAIAGSGLSPILEHWAMLMHPPLLYIGLGLALVPATVSPSRARGWSTAAIAVLTAALALGGAWAYVELGWGGWYAWDPVENVALIPWLLLVAAQHLPMNHGVARWMALLIWPAVFCGTAMTRTSLRTSVHAFANSEDLGWVLWPLAIVVSLWTLACGIKDRHHMGWATSTRRLIPVIVLGYSAIVVVLGTFRPFLPGEATDGPFYSRFLFPAAIVGLITMGIAPRWRSTHIRVLTTQAGVGTVAGIISGALVGWSTWWQLSLAAATGCAVATTIGGGFRPTPRTLAHLGITLVLTGALGGTASISQTHPLDQGESVEVQGHTITNREVLFSEGPPPVVTAVIDIDDNTYQPSITVYAERRLRLPEVVTHRRPHEDIQVILRTADDDGRVLVTINIEPLTQLVWLGALLIVIGFFLAAAQRWFSHRPVSACEPLEVR